MARTTKQQLDRLVERAYYDHCAGTSISVLDIGKVYAAGRAAFVQGGEPALVEAVKAAIVQYDATRRPA
jgi:hypothetical protein